MRKTVLSSHHLPIILLLSLSFFSFFGTSLATEGTTQTEGVDKVTVPIRPHPRSPSDSSI